MRRHDAEWWVPGLPARRTYKALGWAVVAVVVVVGALAWAPPSAGVDALDGCLRYGSIGVGVALAACSLLSEMRGWEGSDAATCSAADRDRRRGALSGSSSGARAARTRNRCAWREPDNVRRTGSGSSLRSSGMTTSSREATPPSRRE